MAQREAEPLALLHELAAVLHRQQEAAAEGNWDVFAEASGKWQELTARIDLADVSDPEAVRQALLKLQSACDRLNEQVSGALQRQSASLASVRQQRTVLHSYGGLGRQMGISYYIDEKK